MNIDPRIIGMIMNAIRGAQWKAFVPEKYHWINSDLINSTIYMATVYYLTNDIYTSMASFVAMWLGAMMGWGDYIGALGSWRKDDLQENKYIDPLIKWLLKYPRWWGFAGLTLRGAIWGLCLAIPFGFAGLPFIYMGATMGLCYFAAIEYAKSRIPEGNWAGMGWGLGEIFYGYALWSALPLVVQSAKISTT